MTEYKCGSAESCKYGDMCKPNFNIGVCVHYKAEEPMTNEEWFCQLSTEEKAKWMAKHMSFCEVCEIVTCLGGGCERFDRKMNEKDAFEDWLKEIHHEV